MQTDNLYLQKVDFVSFRYIRRVTSLTLHMRNFTKRVHVKTRLIACAICAQGTCMLSQCASLPTRKNKLNKYENQVRCRDGTVPKTIDTRRDCKVGLRACNNLPQPPPYILLFRGCGRLLHALNPTLQCLLVSIVFCTVSSLHLT